MKQNKTWKTLKKFSKYRTLEDEILDLSHFSNEEKKFLERILDFYSKKPDWNEFARFWLSKIHSVYEDKNRAQISQTTLFAICQDLESRLGILQKKTRMPDYRDQLREIIDVYFGSRYKFCKRFKLDQGYLSKVLRKERHFSLENLQRILDKAGFELEIRTRLQKLEPYTNAKVKEFHYLNK